MDPSNYVPQSLDETLFVADALSAGQCAPAVAAVAVIAYRLVSGWWPKKMATLAPPLIFVLGGWAWMFLAMALGANLATVAAAISYTGGSLTGAAVYAALILLARGIERLAFWRYGANGNQRRHRGKLTVRGSL